MVVSLFWPRFYKRGLYKLIETLNINKQYFKAPAERLIVYIYMFDKIDTEKNNKLRLGLMILGAVVILALLIAPPHIKFIILATSLLFGLTFTVVTLIKNRKEKNALKDNFYAQIEIKRQQILDSITGYQNELNEIQRNIYDLKHKLELNPNAKLEAKRESHKLIGGFEEEKKLRMAKIGFYELCMTKLNSIIKNHQLAEEIKQKRKKLEKFQENNIEDVAEMESIKTFIDFEKTYLDTIDKLSLQVLESRSIEDAEELKLELKEITRELREL